MGASLPVMGRETAAVTLAIVSTRPAGHFTSARPGGYFAGMLRKFEKGELHLERSLWRLKDQKWGTNRQKHTSYSTLQKGYHGPPDASRPSDYQGLARRRATADAATGLDSRFRGRDSPKVPGRRASRPFDPVPPARIEQNKFSKPLISLLFADPL